MISEVGFTSSAALLSVLQALLRIREEEFSPRCDRGNYGSVSRYAVQ
ncbi:MAG: hypothetical protein ABI656_12540 [bacterium]